MSCLPNDEYELDNEFFEEGASEYDNYPDDDGYDDYDEYGGGGGPFYGASPETW